MGVANSVIHVMNFLFSYDQKTTIAMIDQYLTPLQDPKNKHPLNSLEDLLLELPLNLLALVIGSRLAVQGKQSTQVELGGLEKLDLADVDL